MKTDKYTIDEALTDKIVNQFFKHKRITMKNFNKYRGGYRYNKIELKKMVKYEYNNSYEKKKPFCITYEDVKEFYDFVNHKHPTLLKKKKFSRFIYNEWQVRDFVYLYDEFTIQDVFDNPMTKWDIRHIQKHKNFTMDWYFKYPNIGWIMSDIYKHKLFKKEHLKHFKVDKSILENPNFHIDWVQNIEIEIDFDELNKHKNFTIDWYKNNPQYDWKVCQNPNFTIEWLEDNGEIPWDISDICENPNFNLKWVKKYPDIPWHYETLADRLEFSDEVIDLIYKKIDNYLDFMSYEKIAKSLNTNYTQIETSPELLEYLEFIERPSFKLFSKYPDANWKWTIIQCADWINEETLPLILKHIPDDELSTYSLLLESGYIKNEVNKHYDKIYRDLVKDLVYKKTNYKFANFTQTINQFLGV